MMNIIQWLNDNQGFVMSLLTLIYVLTTVVIVLYNRKTIKEMQESREAESRPYIFIYLDLDPRETNFRLRVKNYGKSGGKIEMVSFDPNPIFLSDVKPENIMKDVVFAPLQSVDIMLKERKTETIKCEYRVKLHYSSVSENKKVYKEEYVLVMQYAGQMGYSEHKKSKLSDEANALTNIASHLDYIKRKV